MERTLVVESCEMVGAVMLPATPKIVTPLLMFPAMILFCSVVEMETEPPDV